MPTRTCSVPGCVVLTSRADGVCDSCWRARQFIEQSETQADLERFIRSCEADWRLMDRIDWSLGIPIRRSRPTS